MLSLLIGPIMLLLLTLFLFVCFSGLTLFLFISFLATPRGLWDLSSPTRDRTHALGNESKES